MRFPICVLLLASTLSALADRAGENGGSDASQKAEAPAPSERLNFHTDIFTGRFGYQLPFNLAPGRHGSTPTLALSYNSSSDDGWCGVGWNLDFGYIQRITKRGVPVTWSSGAPQKSYDDGKGFTFSLNGQAADLVSIGNNEYRAEVEGGFLRFVLVSASNQWQVTDKSGNRYYFGQTSASRMVNSKTGWSATAPSGTFRWALSHVETVLGDTVDYSYTNLAGSLYPLKISYNGFTNGLANSHTVDFILSTRANDVRVSYLSGYRVEQNQRLQAMVHKVGSMIVWSNRFAYATSPSTQRTLLSSSTLWGTNLTADWPAISFGYTTQHFGFQPVTYWTNLSIPTGGYPNYYLVSYTANPDQMVDLIDMDGDGLPDRVYQAIYGPYTNLWVQRNNGTGFENPVAFGPLFATNYFDGVNTYSMTNLDWAAINGAYMRFLDMNNDGLPDRVMDPLESLSSNNGSPYTNLVVQVNVSSNLDGTVRWTNVVGTLYKTGVGPYSYRASENGVNLLMLDMNGDGLPDRIMTKVQAPYDAYFVQFNTGSGFTGTNAFSFDPYDNPANPGLYGGTLNSYFLRLIDLNGDGLPDRVFYPTNSTGTPEGLCDNLTSYLVQFNNGYSFEPTVSWGGLSGQYLQGQPCPNSYFCPESDPSYGGPVIQDCDEHVLRDINGDGLPDRIYRYRDCSITNLYVQINTGTNFAAPVRYGPYYSQNNGNLSGLQGLSTHFVDIDGDGLPDHVMYSDPLGVSTRYAVELSKGPVPDLLSSVNSGIGGNVTVAYKPSTKYDNREVAGSANAKKLLPFVMQTVASVSESDGINPSSTTAYGYEGGMWAASRREFHGFARVTETDPLGTTNVHYFHQAGGRDHSSLGEYQDTAANIGKNGMPFRIDTYGSDGRLYRTILNKVDDASLGSGRHFGYITQTLALNYPGTTNNTYRGSAEGFAYNVNTGNPTGQTNYGEIASIVASAWTWNNLSTTDEIYQATVYASLSNTNILDKPQRLIVTSDSAGQDILRETLFDYEGKNGNLTVKRQRICAGSYLTTGFGYDGYNNPKYATNAAGILTTTTFDSTYQTFPAAAVTATFNTSTQYDPRNGKLLSSTDSKGLVTVNGYDARLRLRETDVSSVPFGAANVWLVKYDYNYGMASGFSTNSVRVRKNDGVDATNGHDTWTYFDGLARPYQVREEAEGSNGFRVTDTVYDKRGNVVFTSLPFFSATTNYTKPTTGELGTYREYDPIGRPIKATAGETATFSSGQFVSASATGGDTGSPLGPAIIAYNDGNDPWTLVRTDEQGKVRKFVLDAYGRTNQIIEVTGQGNYSTRLGYDLTGVLTNLTDNANNIISYAYNDVGQLVAMADPDMGRWDYRRDLAGRLREQVDAKTNLIRFDYTDALGRLKAKLAYNSQGTFVYGVTNIYDTSDDPNFTVYSGQLYMVIDPEGWTKNSYDLRGRVVKTARYVVKNGQTYTSQFAYDEEDRVTQTIYPNGGPTVTNIYDTGGNLSQVKQVGGSGTVYYSARGFNQIGQLLGINFGNSTVTTNDYYSNSKRLRRIVTFKTGSTNIQDLTYQYDKVSNLASLSDGVYSGTASAALTGISYDDLHRLTGFTRNGTNVSFSYTSIGNINVNGENGGGLYGYGSRMPHAVKQANGANYAYDSMGNMLVRAGTQRLDYDLENRLILVATANATITFGYDGGGARLWKQGTNSLQVWIGNHYEEKNGRVLFHIMEGDRIICTFDPTGTNVFEYYHPDHLRSTAILTDQNGNRIQHYEYSAFGQSRYTESSSAFAPTRRYTSQFLDEDTGLYYYGARYYDPQLGRFIQPDTTIEDLFNPQAINRYSYTLNNPLKYIDPTGHGTYFQDVGQVFVGYYDAGKGIVKGAVFLVRHPVVSVQGVGHAVAHPVTTGKAIANGVEQTWNSGLRGQGEVVGNVLFTVATAVAPAAQVGNVTKAGQVANVASKVEQAVATAEKISALTEQAAATGSRTVARFVARETGEILDTAAIRIPGPVNSPFGKLDYLLGRVASVESKGKGGFFKGVMGFNDETLSTALRNHLVENFASAEIQGNRIRVVGSMAGVSGKTGIVQSVWQITSKGTVDFITAFPK